MSANEEALHSQSVAHGESSDRSPWHDASLFLLSLPQGVNAEASTLYITAISADGAVLVGQATHTSEVSQTQDGGHATGPGTFRWDLASNNWQWLDQSGHLDMAMPVGISASGDVVFGRQWLWRAGWDIPKPLEDRSTWLYAVRDDKKLMGIGAGYQVVMLDADGHMVKQWNAGDIVPAEMSVAQRQGGEGLRFSGNGTLLLDTMAYCLKAPGCSQADLVWWTPENGVRRVVADLSDCGEDMCLQTTPGLSVVSRNGQWLVGSIGNQIYLWDAQGHARMLGGFKQSAVARGISDDGQVVIGTVLDALAERSWIWTATEGLGWLDEWLRDHGVPLSEVNNNAMQVRLLSADRRMIVGFTDLRAQKNGALVWWRVALPEKMRVLVY